MRKIITAIVCSFFALGCEDVIEVTLPENSPRLVIDAEFAIFTQEVPLRAEGQVRLSLSANYFDKEVPIVTNAKVLLTNLSNGQVYPLPFNNNSGSYTLENVAVLNKLDTIFELSVMYQNETYKGTASFIKVAPIDTAVQGKRTLFGGDEIEVIISFLDDKNTDNYYLYDFGFNDLTPIEDRFFQGEIFRFSQFYEAEDVQVGDTVTIKAFGIDRQYYNYIELLLEQVGGAGGPFQTIPANLRGNMLNTTKFKNYPLGYFSIAEANQIKLLIQDLNK